MSSPISRRHFVKASVAAPFVLSGCSSLGWGAPSSMKLAGFADEISPKLKEQIRVCKDLGIRYFELRGVVDKNVLDFDVPLRTEIRKQLQDNGMAVACIGSPIGKVKITDPWPAHFDRFKVAVDMAEFFRAPLIRLFSYYPQDKGQDLGPIGTRSCGGCRPRPTTSRTGRSRLCTRTRRTSTARRGPRVSTS